MESKIPAYNYKSDNKDSVLYMMLRREINEKHAEQPVDFNAAGLMAGQRVLGRPYRSDDKVLDIGSNSGLMIAEAAIKFRSKAQIICLEPDAEAADAYRRLPEVYRKRISFIRGEGENIPLQDNSVQGATLHNVIFRVHDAVAVLQEIKRVVRPDGFVAISSNAEGHAKYRHLFEAGVAHEVMRLTGVEFTAPRPPAEGRYIENLPSLVQSVGGLVIMEDLYLAQNTRAIIARGEPLEDYIDSIKYSAANTDLPDRLRYDWRQVVEHLVRPIVEAEIAKSPEEDGSEQFFTDTIRRGMIVARNQK